MIPAQSPTPKFSVLKTTTVKVTPHFYMNNQNATSTDMPVEKLHIAISGLIGAGKTTLCTALSKQMNLPAFYESVIDNEYLDDFYKDQKKYGFALQIYLLNQRFQQQQKIIWTGTGGVQDRSIYEDRVFAKLLYKSGMMEERDFKTYISLFANMSNFMKKPNLIVHLDVSPEESLRRIKSRNRGMETGIKLEYLQGLHQAYEEFLQEISRVIPVIRINWSEFQDEEEMAILIKQEWENMQNIHYVDFVNDHQTLTSSPAKKE